MYKYLIIILTTTLLALQSCTDSVNSVKENPKDLLSTNHITLKKGETFTIKMFENSSTGLSRCWINQTKCDNIKLFKRYYKAKGKKGCDGCGGSVYWSFRALNNGFDTIRIKTCPTGIEQKPCEYFNEDSDSYKKMIKYTPKVDRVIFVRILDK